MALGRMSFPKYPRSPPSFRVAASSEYSRARLAKSSVAARYTSLRPRACFSATTPASAPSGMARKMWLARTSVLALPAL